MTILISACNQKLFHARSTHRILSAAFTLLIAFTPFAAAQATLTYAPAADVIAANTRFDLPDAPGASLISSSSGSVDSPANSADPTEFSFDQTAQATVPKSQSTPKHALHMQMVISPQEIADPMSAHDKVLAGLKDSVSLFSMAGWLGAAGWEQLWNDSPNYGTDAGAFGQRLGAAAIRGTSENIFSNCLFAPLFREDPRYYIMGKGHSFFKRAVYAGTRVLITRTDGGHATPNFALLVGNAAGSALTIPYYPAKNTTFSEVAQTFGGSLGGSAVGFVVNEFILDVLIELHIKKQQP